MGVHAVRAAETEEFLGALERALATPGPHLIEAVVPPALAGLKLKLLPHILGSLDSMAIQSTTTIHVFAWIRGVVLAQDEMVGRGAAATHNAAQA